MLSIIEPGSIIQVTAGTIISFSFFSAYALCKPFVHAGGNVVTTMFQLSTFIFFFVGLLLKMRFPTSTAMFDSIVLVLFILSFSVPVIPIFFRVRPTLS